MLASTDTMWTAITAYSLERTLEMNQVSGSKVATGNVCNKIYSVNDY